MEPLFEIKIRQGRINERRERGERVADNHGDGRKVRDCDYAEVEEDSELKETHSEHGKDDHLHVSTE